MQKLLFLALGAIFLVMSGIVAFMGDKGEVYWGLPLCLGLLFAGISIVVASKKQQITLPPPAKKYPSMNLFHDRVDAKKELKSNNTQSYMIWAFCFLVGAATIFWSLNMIFYFKAAMFLAVVDLVAFMVRYFSGPTLAEAGVRLEQGTDENHPRLSV